MGDFIFLGMLALFTVIVDVVIVIMRKRRDGKVAKGATEWLPGFKNAAM